MKIKIEVDAAYAFDLLSILEVKKEKILDSKKLKKINESISIMESNLIGQIGLSLYETIVDSPEYKELLLSNLRVFESVDIGEDINRQNEVTPYSVAQDVLYRYNCKQKLQEKFFQGTELLEVKKGEYHEV